MTTKDKILDKALELFNQEGTDTATVRSIAKALDMSHGNLCYHFPTTDDIIEALYMRLVGELNATIGTTAGEKIDLKFIYGLTLSTYQKLYTYRFLLLDFVRIMRRLPKIKAHYRELVAQRKEQFRLLIIEMVNNDIINPPLVPNQYDSWVESAILFGDFWLSHAEIMYDGAAEDKVKTYHLLFMNLSMPYLTKKGLKQLSKVLKGE